MLIKFPDGTIINTDLVRMWYVDEKRVARSECEQLRDKIAEEHLRDPAVPVLIQELVDQIRENERS